MALRPATFLGHWPKAAFFAGTPAPRTAAASEAPSVQLGALRDMSAVSQRGEARRGGGGGLSKLKLSHIRLSLYKAYAYNYLRRVWL